jgi:hypothetical protein
MKLNKNNFILFVVTSAFIGSGVWFVNTPRYSLFLMGKAIESGNTQEILSYIDSDAFVKQYVEIGLSEFKKQALQNLSQQNGFEALGTTIGITLLDNMRSALEESAKENLIRGIEENLTHKRENVAINMLFANLESRNNKVLLKLDGSNQERKITILYLEKQGSKWRIVGADEESIREYIKGIISKNNSNNPGENYDSPGSSSNTNNSINETPESIHDDRDEPEQTSNENFNSLPLNQPSSSTRIVQAGEGYANLRNEPSTEVTSLQQVPNGTSVNILSEQTNSSGQLWYKVEVNGQVGWIYSELLK